MNWAEFARPPTVTPAEFNDLYLTEYRAPPRQNQVDDWATADTDYGRGRTMSCRLTLCCGHQIPLAVSYPAPPPLETLRADNDARRKLQAAVTQHVDTHDCAAYVRQRLLAKVTARLKQ